MATDNSRDHAWYEILFLREGKEAPTSRSQVRDEDYQAVGSPLPESEFDSLVNVLQFMTGGLEAPYEESRIPDDLDLPPVAEVKAKHDKPFLPVTRMMREGDLLCLYGLRPPRSAAFIVVNDSTRRQFADSNGGVLAAREGLALKLAQLKQIKIASRFQN